MVEKIKKAIEGLYTEKCTVYEKEAEFENGRTVFREKVKYENIPCRVSMKAYLFGENAGNEKKGYLNVTKKAKIFVPPEYEIKPGSRIAVQSNTNMVVYTKSGQMSRYASHNEVTVETEKKFA